MKKNHRKNSLAKSLALIAAAAPAFVSWDVCAAESSVSDKAPVKTQKPGFYTGTYRILPELQATGYYDDNIFAIPDRTKSDYVAVITPSLKIDSLWDKHSLKFDTGARLGYYKDYSDENYQDYWINLKGKYELGENTSLSGGLGTSRKHEGRDSRESTQIQKELTTYQVNDLQLGVRHRQEDYTYRLGVTYQSLDFDDVTGIKGQEINNDDRDRKLTGLGLRVSKRLNKQFNVFAQGLLNDRRYVEDVDFSGTNRDSSGYSAAIGVIQGLPRKGRIEAYIGLLSQRYDDATLDNVTKPDYGANVRLYPNDSLKFTGKLTRALKETTDYDFEAKQAASGYLYTRLDLQLDTKFTSDIVGYISYGYGVAEFQMVRREDKENVFGLGVNYYMSPRVFFGASYSHLDNDSNESFFDYKKNVFLLTAKVKLAPAGQ